MLSRIAKQKGQNLLSGPMLGNVTEDGIQVWVRTWEPAEVSVEVFDSSRWKRFGPVRSTVESDLAAVIPIQGLRPETSYRFRVRVNGDPVTDREGQFTTTPSSRNGKRVRLAFGSCFHRWGLGNPRQVEQILKRHPAAMLLLGDIAVQDRNNHCGMHRADYLLRDMTPAWQTLSRHIPVYATWDDHDYFDNDLSGIPEGFTLQDKKNVCEVFRNCWNNPQYGTGNDGEGVYFRTRIGPCDIIMLDNRYFRTGQKGVFLGETQMKWLQSQLLDCKGPFIILSCGTMWSDYVSDGKDSWGACDPQGRERLFRFIEQNRIPGVLLISGDRHGARGFRIPRPSGFSFYEFGAASLGGRSGPPVSRPTWDTQLYGIANIYAFGEFTFETRMSDPRVTFRLISDHGKSIYQLTLTQSQLTPAGIDRYEKDGKDSNDE